MTCETCGSPGRAAICLDVPKMDVLHAGNFLSLEQCNDCSYLWATALYEPFASFKYAVPWEKPPEDWHKIYGLDDGRTMALWIDRTLINAYPVLQPKDSANAGLHRQRAYSASPFFEMYATPQEVAQLYGQNNIRGRGLPDLNLLLK